MMMGLALKIEGRRGSQRRFYEGGRYLGIPRNRGLAALLEGSECADDHGRVFLTVQETGCGTSLAYDPANRRTSLPSPNGVVATYAYDTASGELHL